jgi:uncharacterized protein DUF1161
MGTYVDGLVRADDQKYPVVRELNEAAKRPAAPPKEGAKEPDAKEDGAAAEGKVVGTCDGGTKQIIYKP